ncbi:hypothetical protein ACFL0R_04740 [Pseudomonadota bacterium]
MINRLMKVLLLTGAVTSITACGDQVNEAASAACECLEPIYEQMEQMTEAMQSGDMAKLSAMTASMDTAQKTQVCLNKVSQDYPDIGKDQETQDRFNARMGELCPAPRMMGM